MRTGETTMRRVAAMRIMEIGRVKKIAGYLRVKTALPFAAYRMSRITSSSSKLLRVAGKGFPVFSSHPFSR